MCQENWEITDNRLFSFLGIRKRFITELLVQNAEFGVLEETLSKGRIPDIFKKKFKAEAISVSNNAVKEGEGKWRTSDENKRYSYIIKKENGKLNIYEDYSFDELIKRISDYVYNEIKLDSRFEIETWLKSLLERELFLSITKKRHRDHLLHACRIALLGERILRGKITYDGNKEFRLLDLVRELFRKQKDTEKLLKLYDLDKATDEELDEKILQIWYIAALFHDVGFIYEAFTEVWKNLQVLVKLPNFKEMHLDVEKALTNFKKGFAVSAVRGKYYESKFTREFDHSKIGAGLISSLLGDSNIICDAAAFIADNHSSNPYSADIDIGYL